MPMNTKTRLLIERITEGELVPKVKAGDGKQQKQRRVLSVENKSAETKGQSVNSRQIAASSWQQDNRQGTNGNGKQEAVGSEQSAGLQDQEAGGIEQSAGGKAHSAKSIAQIAESRRRGAKGKKLSAFSDQLSAEERRNTDRHEAVQIRQKAGSKALSDSCAGRELEEKIRDRSARVGVIGLGYVGLGLAVEMGKTGFQVTGIDVDTEKVDSVNAGISYIPDVTNEVLLSLVAKGKIRAVQSLAAVKDLDTVSICVPTPLRKTKEPDLSYVIAAVEAVRDFLRPEQLIILESTTYPGTTQELVLPTLEQTGLKVGKDFFLAFSPERIDPGNKAYTTPNIPKVVGGVTPRCTELAAQFYHQFVEKIVPVTSPTYAEMVKLLENTFRNVNIALANEMALLCHKLDINVWEVIDAAKTKPFGFMAFYPGPGLGGHCIPVDPYYLTWKARMNGAEPRLIELATSINNQMPAFTISRIADALNEREKSLRGSKILAVGITYKRDASDTRESPALEVLNGLHDKGASVYYSDPFVRSIEINGRVIRSLNLTPEVLESMDCAVVLTDHSSFNYAMISAHSRLIVDCRNVLKGFNRENLVLL